MPIFLTVLALVVVTAVILYLGLRPRGQAQVPPGDAPGDTPGDTPARKVISLVILLRRPTQITLEGVRDAATRVFGTPFSTDPQADANVIALPSKSGISGVGVRSPMFLLGAISSSRPYITNIAQAAEAQRITLHREAIRLHKAWVSVDYFDSAPGLDSAAALPFMAMLLARVIPPDDALAIYETATGRMNSWGLDLLPLLQKGDFEAALTLPRGDPVVMHDPDDDGGKMRQAMEEARRRLSEFVKAFASRRKSQGFAIKSGFHDEGQVEWMWVEVFEIKGDVFSGILANDPQIVKNIRARDPVSVKAQDVADWLYTDGMKNYGNFTGRVLVEEHGAQPGLE